MKFCILFIISIFIIFLSIYTIPEKYTNYSKNYNDINYHNAVFLNKPPYDIASLYRPYTNISPTYLIKSNFLAYPMEGFKNEDELDELDENKSNRIDQVQLESGIPKLLANQKNFASMIKT